MSLSDKFQLDRVIADGRLSLHYQPRISANTLRLVGVEALLRWNTGSQVEHVPLIANWTVDELSRLWNWELIQVEQVFTLLKSRSWSPTLETPGFTIGLNLSPKQLHSDEWAMQLLQTLERAEVPGSCIEVELMEQDGVLNAPCVDWAFESLQKAGVVLVLDDFLIGSSSFLRLSNYKFDKVKVDKMMMPTSDDVVAVWSKRRDLLKGLVNLSKSLGAEVVLKCVEREVQFNFFRELPIVEWQGRYWSDAVEFSKILDMLENPDMLKDGRT